MKRVATPIGCKGTDSKTRTNKLEDLAVGNVLSRGTGVTNAIGVAESAIDSLRTRSRLVYLGGFLAFSAGAAYRTQA